MYTREELYKIYWEGRTNDCEPIGTERDFQQWINNDLQDVKWSDSEQLYIDTY